VVSSVLCVVSVFLVRRAVTPSRQAAGLAPAHAPLTQAPVSRVPVETVANTLGHAAATPSATTASTRRPTPFVAPTPIGKLPAPSLIAEQPGATPGAVSPAPSPSPIATASPAPQMVFDPNVQRAQRLLAELGYSVGRADGRLGPRTEAALEAFQREHALARTKRPDAATLAKLEDEVKRRQVAANARALSATLSAKTMTAAENVLTTAAAAVRPRRLGEPQLLVVKGGPREAELGAVPKLDNKADVVRVQKALAAAGFYRGEIDGRWGRGSLAALQEFQKSVGATRGAKLDQELWRKLVVAAGPTPTPLPDLLVVAPVSRTLKKSKLTKSLAWYTPAPDAPRPATTAPTAPPAPQQASARPSPVSAPASESQRQATPQIRPAAVVPAGTPDNDLAGSGKLDATHPQPIHSSTPAPTGSSLDVASANPVEFATPAAARGNDGIPVLLPRSPNERANGTYATAATANASQAGSARIATVARETNPSRVLVAPTGDSSSTTATADSSDPNTLAGRLRAAARQLEQTPPKSKREQAEEKVRAVESVFNELKRRWAGKFRSGAVGDQIASVESGFASMKSDFQKGEYDRIIARGDGFKRAIEIVAAHAYVAAMLNKPEVRAKIPRSDLQAIEILRREAERNPERLDRQEKFLDAAALIKSRIEASASSTQQAKTNRNSKPPR
ncbi:MAG: peptidoglycan-binding domain-containing protein, partial [Candidatus Sumerlaeaceae bacterium]